MEQEGKNRKKNLKEFIIQNWILISIIVFSLIIRFYYFFITSNQSVWYDEGEYLATAKNWAFGIPFEINSQRPILLPLLETIILLLGGGETLVRFFLIFLPSIGIVIISYLIGKQMFGKKIGLITAAIMGSFWLLLFNTTRIHVEAMLMFFIYLSIFCFWKGFVEGNNKYKLLMGLFIGLSFLTKFTAILTLFTIGIFLLLIQRSRIFKDKYFWFSGLIAFITILPYLIWSKIKFGDFLIFLRASSQVGALVSGQEIGGSFGWHILGNIPHFTSVIFLIFFFVGLLTLYKLILGFDLVIKNKNKDLQGLFFIVLFFLINLSFFIFIQRDAEDRWLLPIALPLFLFVALGLKLLYELLIKIKLPKALALIILLVLLFAGIYSQIDKADDIIKIKKDTYLQVKQAALWMKENTNKNDVLMTSSGPQTTYYAERWDVGWTDSEEGIEKILGELKPKYATISIFEQHPDLVQPYVQNHPEIFVPVQVFYLDPQQQRLALVIYKINTDNLLE